MEYDLERKIKLCEESEFESLYKWSLQETDENEEQIGRDLIPWRWTLSFTVRDLCYHWSTKTEAGDIDDPVGASSTTEKEYISGHLRPGFSKHGIREDETTYSMFGTGRPIKQFLLFINKLTTADGVENCRLWGSPRYTAEIDYRYEVFDDVVQVDLFLCTEKFERLAHRVRAEEVDTAQLSLGHVSGFYSEWSPDVSTDNVKVLAAGSEQEIQGVDSSEISPPRLGDVGEFEFSTLKRGERWCRHNQTSISTNRFFEEVQKESESGLRYSDTRIGEYLNRFLEQELPRLPEDKENNRPFYSQFNAIAGEVAKNIARYSTAVGDKVDQFSDRLWDAFDVLTSIRDATNQEARIDWAHENESAEKKAAREIAEHTIWRHGQASRAFQEGYESEYARKIEVDSLEEQTRKYLLRPWMKSEQLECVIVDALAFATVTNFGEELKKHMPGPFSVLGLNMAYVSAKGNVQKMLWKRIQHGLTKFAIKLGVFAGVPIALGWYFWNQGRQDEVAIAGVAYTGLVILYLAYRLIHRLFGKRQTTVFEKYQDVLNDMFVTYEMLNAQVLSPTLIRDRLLDEAKRGAVWSGTIFSILDHAIQRNPAVWGATERDKYQGS